MDCLAVDCRERALIQCLAARGTPHQVMSLPAGDVLRKYEGSAGSSWILERKRADDFADSIRDGRWREQSSRLFASGLRLFFVIEGDLRWLDCMYEPMIGAIVNASLRSSCCFRTWDTDETACLVLHLEKRCRSVRLRPSRHLGFARHKANARKRPRRTACLCVSSCACPRCLSE